MESICLGKIFCLLFKKFHKLFSRTRRSSQKRVNNNSGLTSTSYPGSFHYGSSLEERSGKSLGTRLVQFYKIVDLNFSQTFHTFGNSLSGAAPLVFQDPPCKV